MRRIIVFFAKYLSPVTAMVYFALSVILLAVAEQKKVLLFTLLWAVFMAALLYGGVYGVLTLARKRLGAGTKELRLLVRGTEIAEVLFSAAATVGAILLYDLPAAANLIPVALFGLGGALRFDMKYLS